MNVYTDPWLIEINSAIMDARPSMNVPHKSPDVGCGTEGGYARHVRAGTPKCDACRAGHRAYQRAGKMRAYQGKGQGR